METAVEPRPHRPSLGATSRPVDLDIHDAGVSTLAEAALATSPNKIDPTIDPSLQPAMSSPKAERLPSFRQLSKLAAAGEETGSQTTNGGVATSPTAAAAVPVQPPQSATFTQSPTGVLSDPTYDPQVAGSPTSQAIQPLPAAALAAMANSIPHAAVYPDGVPGANPYTTPYYGQPQQPMAAYTPTPSLPAQQSSSSDNAPQPDTIPDQPPSLPAPTAVMELDPAAKAVEVMQPLPAPAPPGTHVCEHPGCTAPPFQTQYLLNSHANVHSSNRPHFCTVVGCPRGPGGKGFKRKNEMIRHGLVHDSPGYMCPFCSDREHKYPRPDNLQRHVRVHHVDKDKDDPALREVLSQRLDGVKSRRQTRRTGP